ncbi:50S ribosome-binding GTPase [Candidatus Pacearchaeota archaeon]|nr:50S ribosome-binding GTPase [Candidatus Pacearchaeota archaeon]
MASTNQSPFYKKAEENFLNSKTDEEKLTWLEEMIRECPKHKSSEKMLANLKTRRIKLIEKIDRIKKSRKSGKSSQDSIKKYDMQAVLVGKTNSGKSLIISLLTNANSTVSESQFTTKNPIQGIMEYGGVQIQIIDNPSVKNDNFDVGIANNTDLVILVVTDLSQIEEVNKFIPKAKGKKLIVFNKTDLLNEKEKRKISETLKSKKYNFIMISSKNNQNVEELKEKIFQSFNITRIYLKEPGKYADDKPLIIQPNSTILDVAKKISRQMAENIKEVHIWGPSSKFPNQKVGLAHIVKDKDIVEFKTR